MAYGIRVESNSGFTQIDQDFVNYVLVASGSLTFTGGFGGNPDSKTVNFGALVNTNDTIVFARPLTMGVGLIGYSNATSATIIATAPSVVQWRVYERSNSLPPPVSGYGLNVFRPDNSLAFSSQYNPPRIFSILESAPNFSVGTVSHSYSEIPFALMQNGYEWIFFPEDDPIPNTIYYMAVFWSANQLSVEGWAYDTFDEYNGVFWQLTGVRAWAFIQG